VDDSAKHYMGPKKFAGFRGVYLALVIRSLFTSDRLRIRYHRTTRNDREAANAVEAHDRPGALHVNDPATPVDLDAYRRLRAKRQAQAQLQAQTQTARMPRRGFPI
jgi:hypothetical protein